MRNGYSLVPCSEPRYLRIRSRRVEVCSVTRWSSTITQSETYSSMPWRVSVPSPRSPVITAVTPRSLSQPNSRRSSARRIAVFVNAPNSVSMRVDHDPLGADLVDRGAEAEEQARRGPSSPVSSTSPAVDARRGRSPGGRRPAAAARSKPSEATLATRSSTDLLEGDEHAGLAELGDPPDQELHREQRLAAAGRPADQRRPARGSPPPVTSSRPLMPVGALGRVRRSRSAGGAAGGGGARRGAGRTDTGSLLLDRETWHGST